MNIPPCFEHVPDSVSHASLQVGEVRDRSNAEAENALSAARVRLAASHADYQRHRAPSNAVYYPDKKRASAEQSIDDLVGIGSLDAVVTRNHYGSVVLNAHHALFIDVDMPEASNPPRHASAFRKPSAGPWQSTFDDLCTVLGSERSTGFRIYRTAAGFRILATTHEFEPESESARELMLSVGADDAFIRLCGVQKTFRARLTPKPWRCGASHPPNQFPRQTPEEQTSFDEWLSQYERASRERATCQFLGSVGPNAMHQRVAPIIEFHDRETKAFQSLDLA
jgi:hypothetical protein